MYKEHDALTPLPPDAILWRYMDFTKFVSLLDKQALFFVRADKLEDPFEGFWPTANRANLENLFERIPLPVRNTAQQTMHSFIKALPRFTLINCWHESPGESVAMWKLYSKMIVVLLSRPILVLLQRVLQPVKPSTLEELAILTMKHISFMKGGGSVHFYVSAGVLRTSTK